ncbi:TetR/AcrR family transcriptional regulator [Pseudoduganella namucuonensis]|uniref:Transcriptional regulator, TetR family n=1 Tax=Pseudoduganella namucuonensis TaxID=1035707 RepID=A0A1I7M018_9BURK|nr:TetR/AcrR family transcriptional regulator [Pseudoduganella namucuonensis]SFV15256.1 transcriptional regulator, TetR family [Pseudoduganella namucuonensis]
MRRLGLEDAGLPRARRGHGGVGGGEGGGAGQAEKGGQTRVAILEATLECLVDFGYAQTTADKIVKRAGVSRGAMTHYFKARAEVFDAAALFVIERRAEEYDRMIGRIRAHPAGMPTLDDMRATMAVLQRYFALPSFLALNELQRGARTDLRFRRAMQPLEKALDGKISDSMVKHFPFLSEVEETRQVLTDLILSSLRPVAIGMAPALKGARLQRLVDQLAAVALRVISEARNKHIQPEGDAT